MTIRALGDKKEKKCHHECFLLFAFLQPTDD